MVKDLTEVKLALSIYLTQYHINMGLLHTKNSAYNSEYFQSWLKPHQCMTYSLVGGYHQNGQKEQTIRVLKNITHKILIRENYKWHSMDTTF